jgi:hypothetical protein
VTDARGALQSIRFDRPAHGVNTSGRPLGIGCSFRVPGPLQYRPYWLGDSTLPLAVSSAVWSSRNGCRLVAVKHPDRALSSSSASRKEYSSAEPSPSAAANRLLSWAFVPYNT